MRIALIGGSGYVGTRVAQRAALSNDSEVVPVIRSYGGLSRLSRLGVSARIADASDRQSLEKALDGMDAVVNMTMGDNSRILPDTKAIWEACRSVGVPVMIQLSTGAVHGRAEQPDITEDSPPEHELLNEYARAKWIADAWLRAKFGAGKPRIAVLRPGLVWGPGSGWIINPARAILDGTACLVDGGKWVCNLIYVDNLVECILAVAREGARVEGVFNVGDREQMTWLQYYTAVAREAGLTDIVFPSMAEADYHEPLQSRLRTILRHSWAKKVKSFIPVETKKSLKDWLARRLSAREPRERIVVPAPSMVRDTWWLQATRKKLPTARFDEAYGGKVRLVPFKEAMARTGEWMRFAGFSTTDLHS